MTDAEILNLMGQINRACQAALQQSETMKLLDLAVFPARLLSVISRSPGRSQQALAELLERDKAQVARTLRELEAKGLVTRSAHKTDWRSLCPALTDEGSRIAWQLNQERVGLAARMMADISEEEKPLLANLLQRMLTELVLGREPDKAALENDKRRSEE